MRARAPWQDGRRAWERLNGWHISRPASEMMPGADGDAALRALVDTHLVRHLLDQAELNIVKTARHRGKTWTDIATVLQISREAARERWRDLDGASPSTD